jgi:regulator of sigma E protease
MILTALVFILLLSGLVLMHELGHFMAARWAGVRVEQFSIFFPPHIFKRRVGRTELAVGTIPLGGYVKLVGEETATKGSGSFAAAPWGARFGIILAGVGMNVLTTVTLLWIGFMVGMPPLVSTPAELGVSTAASVVVTAVQPASAAESVGIRLGDVVTGFSSASELQAFTAAHRGQTVTLAIRRGDATINIQPLLTLEGPPLGIGLGEATLIRTNPITALRLAVIETGRMVRSMGNFLKDFAVGLFGHARLASEVAGPVGIFVYTGQALSLGFVYLIQLAAMISLNLALINVLPFPGLDGARALFILLEGLFDGRVLHETYEAIVHAVGFWLLIAFFIALTVRDLVKFF